MVTMAALAAPKPGFMAELRALSGDSTRWCRQSVLKLDRELLERRALLDLGDQPIGFASATRPRL